MDIYSCMDKRNPPVSKYNILFTSWTQKYLLWKHEKTLFSKETEVPTLDLGLFFKKVIKQVA